MNSIATNRDALLQITAATLAELQASRFEPLLVSRAGADSEAMRAQRDTVVNALAAALDFARLEGGLIRTTPQAITATVTNVPYLPSNQALALMQSAIDEFAEDRPIGIEAAFDPTDPGWISSAFEKLKALFRGKHKFTKHTSLTSFRQPLPDEAVVALFSDWGTGEETARRVMRQVKRTNPSIAVHLGDVYYSGTKKEIQRRFLEVIDREGPSQEGCRFFALNSNHEMYSGGDAYFDITLPRFGQEASYFNLRNNHWQLIGLDSGYEDHGLQDPQKEWLEAQLQANGPRNILLTHHQFFSPFEDRAFDRKLHDKVEPLLRHVFAWIWGHEHKAIIFGDHKGIRARCIGHGAIPVHVPFGDPQITDIPVKQIDERAAPGSDEGIHGFALLRFNGPSLKASFIDEFGNSLFEEQLSP
jgi:hypothetical protein